ncbi:unnamed protein product [Brassica napus]|uniref:(rape) hypothetical protein n=1 Tax=Brassica napus TaxID=3708 RepID=A0A816P9W0_BRANA|nr:unnamed protein product [Brassica napus]CAF2045122.1 unnamed protein product [Brassica napus]
MDINSSLQRGMQFQMGEIGRGHFGCTCSASLSSRMRAQGSGGCC